MPYPPRVILNCSEYCTVNAAAIVGDELVEPHEQLWGSVKDTLDAVQQIQALVLPQEATHEVWLVTAGIEDHYPNAPRANCRRHAKITWLKNHSHEKAKVLAKLEQLVSDNIYFTDDVGGIIMADDRRLWHRSQVCQGDCGCGMGCKGAQDETAS